jgi:hypothetical protein
VRSFDITTDISSLSNEELDELRDNIIDGALGDEGNEDKLVLGENLEYVYGTHDLGYSNEFLGYDVYEVKEELFPELMEKWRKVFKHFGLETTEVSLELSSNEQEFINALKDNEFEEGDYKLVNIPVISLVHSQIAILPGCYYDLRDSNREPVVYINCKAQTAFEEKSSGTYYEICEKIDPLSKSYILCWSEDVGKYVYWF